MNYNLSKTSTCDSLDCNSVFIDIDTTEQLRNSSVDLVMGEVMFVYSVLKLHPVSQLPKTIKLCCFLIDDLVSFILIFCELFKLGFDLFEPI